METSDNCAQASSSSEADLKIKEEEFSSDDNEAMAAVTAGSEGDGKSRVRQYCTSVIRVITQTIKFLSILFLELRDFVKGRP